MLTLYVGSSPLLVLAGLFALAVVWISKQGGWKGEGCGGNCASCHQHCDTPRKENALTAMPPDRLSGGILRHRAP